MTSEIIKVAEDLPRQRVSFAPRNYEEALKFAQAIAASDLAPRDFRGKPANCLIAMQMGAELGLSPMQAIQNIAVINGRPCLYGDALLAVVIGHPAYEWHKETMEGTGDQRAAVFAIKRRGQDAYTVRFSVADAKLARLWGKDGPWTTYPNRMLQMRARAWGLRDKFADALRGIQMTEEALDIPAAGTTSLPSAAEHIETVVAAPCGTDGAKRFLRAWRESGKQADEVKAYLREQIGVTDSRMIPVNRLEEAIAWAASKAEEPQTSTSQDDSLMLRARELMDKLGWPPLDQETALSEHREQMETFVKDLEGAV